MDKLSEYANYIASQIIREKTYITLLYKRLYLLKINFANKTKFEKNEIEIMEIETLHKINSSKDYIRHKEMELYDILNK
jgi:hypothetical protein